MLAIVLTVHSRCGSHSPCEVAAAGTGRRDVARTKSVRVGRLRPAGHRVPDPGAGAVFHLVALTIVISIVAHSSTDILVARAFDDAREVPAWHALHRISGRIPRRQKGRQRAGDSRHGDRESSEGYRECWHVRRRYRRVGWVDCGDRVSRPVGRWPRSGERGTGAAAIPIVVMTSPAIRYRWSRPSRRNGTKRKRAASRAAVIGRQASSKPGGIGRKRAVPATHVRSGRFVSAPCRCSRPHAEPGAAPTSRGGLRPQPGAVMRV